MRERHRKNFRNAAQGVQTNPNTSLKNCEVIMQIPVAIEFRKCNRYRREKGCIMLGPKWSMAVFKSIICVNSGTGQDSLGALYIRFTCGTYLVRGKTR
jgi:hypothetical protein